MRSGFPGAGCDPSMVCVVHCQALGERGNIDLFSFVCDAHIVELVMESDLACLGDTTGEKDGRLSRRSRGSGGAGRGGRSPRVEQALVRQGLSSAIGQGDQPSISLGLESQGLPGPGNPDIVEAMVDSHISFLMHFARERFGGR